MKFCISSDEYKPQLMKLWKSAFGNEDEAELFFNNMYSAENTFIALDKDKSGQCEVRAVLYLLPCYMVGIGNCGYIYAATTKQEHRNKGIMRELILYTYNQSKEIGLKAITLVPANDKLYNTYEKYGFATSHYIREVSLGYDELLDVYGKKDYTNSNFDSKMFITRNIQLCNKNYTLLWNNNHIEYAKNYYKQFGDYVATEVGYAFLTWNNDTLFVKEMICNTDKHSILVSTILSKYKKKNIVFRLPTFSPLFAGLGDIKHLGMTLGVSTEMVGYSAYFGLCLD